MKILPALLIFFFLFSSVVPAHAQADEIAQLALNIQKLNQFRQILTDMKKGYEIISKGYNTVKNLSQGNFSLHETFLNGLLAVNPKIKTYKRVADIIIMQKQLINNYKSAFAKFKGSSTFNNNELMAMGTVYDNLFNLSLKNLDELLMIITAGKLRMTDAERLQAIDRIYDDMKEKTDFLQYYNTNNQSLQKIRSQELHSLEVISDLYGY